MGIFILNQFFINFCILSTGLFLIHLCSRKYRVSPSSKQSIRMWAGITQGLFGCVLMHFTIHIEPNVFIDLRIIPMMVAAQVGGWVSCGFATVIIVATRLLFYPLSTSSMVNTILLLVTGACFGIIASLRVKRSYKWTCMATTFLVLLACTIGIVIHDIQRDIQVFVQYAISIGLATYMAQILLSHLWSLQDDFIQFEEESRTDFLTGLNNQRTFTEQITNCFNRAKEKKEPLSLLTIDIDHFKQINDTYGHPTGDQVLKQMSEILTQTCRSIDIVSRNGGEEFTVILPHCESIQAKLVAQRIRTAVESTPFSICDLENIFITVSIGVATVKDYDSVQVEQLIQMSDSALYEAKRSGRNRVCMTSELNYSSI